MIAAQPDAQIDAEAVHCTRTADRAVIVIRPRRARSGLVASAGYAIRQRYQFTGSTISRKPDVERRLRR
ncbi:hypothetical protein A6A06_15230 [Streptomyces sp. CB02923]|nr:hypothetical protein A6A06_15230 [Streptomyces sp. CB02923]